MTEILFPVGRMIGGSMYKPNPKKDNFGKPVLDKTGQPVTSFSFGVALPKTQQDWRLESWGAQILAVGQAAYPGICNTPSFAWKIIDGDSQVPNKKNRKPCDQEGYPGNWVLWFSQSWAPKLVNANGSQELTEPNAVIAGYYVQVFGGVKSNAPSPTPGVYLNPIAVALSGYGTPIETSSVDTTAVGFGASPAPAGMSATPVGMMPPVAPVAPVAPIAPAAPNTSFLQPPSAPSAHQMTPAANGVTYEAYVAQGWSEAMLRQHGLMV
jgi:hypothetical protein